MAIRTRQCAATVSTSATERKQARTARFGLAKTRDTQPISHYDKTASQPVGTKPWHYQPGGRDADFGRGAGLAG